MVNAPIGPTGIRENEIVAFANKRLYKMGSDQAEDFGFASELAAFGLQFGHGLGL